MDCTIRWQLYDALMFSLFTMLVRYQAQYFQRITFGELLLLQNIVLFHCGMSLGVWASCLVAYPVNAYEK